MKSSPGKVERGELRLTGGERRGAKLYTVSGGDVRPALARLRKSLFAMIGPRVEGSVVADLFAGTGSLAFEALSRGAARAVLFETDPCCSDAIRKNIEKLGYGDRTTLHAETAFEAPVLLESSGAAPDLVFVAPPYALFQKEGEWGRLRRTMSELPLSPAGQVILEHARIVDAPGRIGRLEGSRRRDYGGTSITFYHRSTGS